MPNSELEKFLDPNDYGRGPFLGDDPRILDLSPEERLFVSAWRHACPRRKEVKTKFGLEWTRQRYDECNFVFSSIIAEHAKVKPDLYNQLISPVLRLPDEPVGIYEEGAVPESHQYEMSPLSTLWGYALPRVFIEQAGRGKERNWKKYLKAIDLLDEAIKKSNNPIELLANLSEAVIKADAKVNAVLSHVFEPGILLEENCRTMYTQIAETFSEKAPRAWRYYISMTPTQREQLGIIKNPFFFK